jgi:hypothetical protein
MKEDLLHGLFEFQKALCDVSFKLDEHQASLNTVKKVLSKLEIKSKDLELSCREYESKVERAVKRSFSDRIEELEAENRKLNRQILRLDKQNSEQFSVIKRLVGTEHDGEGSENDEHRVGGRGSDSERQMKRVASTISIIEKYLGLICEDDDGFERISKAVIIPNLYSKLTGRNCDKYYLDRIPDLEKTKILVEEGRKFIAEVVDKAPSSLINQDAWDASIDDVEVWWKTVLPLFYGFGKKEEEELFCEDPYSLEQVKRWFDPESRVNECPYSYAAWEQFKEYSDEVTSENGVDEIDSYYRSIKRVK